MRKNQKSEKSEKKIKAEGTQEFFNKKLSKAFTFNKAPVNKDEARQTVKQKVIEKIEKEETGLEEKEHSKTKKRSNFMAKLYRDEDVDELKVLAGEDFDSEIEGDVEKPVDRKREKKLKEKSESKTLDSNVSALKINKLKFEKGSVALFAVSEINQNHYAIVNHTRNVKGYIDLKENPYQLYVGQLVVAQVKAVGTGHHNTSTSRNLNRKLQLSLDSRQINKGLAADKVTTGMVLQAVVESKEQKGYLLNLGFKDESKGFLKSDGEDLKQGQLIIILVKKIASKVIRCELLGDLNKAQTVQTDENPVTINTLKPGFLVNAKVSRLFENGIELSFLGGMNGTVFADHLDKQSIANYKIGEKVKARVISADLATKTSSLSLLPHIIALKAATPTLKIGSIFQNAKVEKIIVGNSFLLRLDKENVGLLHKSNIPREDEQTEDPVPDEESKILDEMKIKKKKKKQIQDADCLLKVGQQIESVRIKEFNYFDGHSILSMKEDVLGATAINYNSIKIGDFTFATIENVNELTKVITLKISEFVKGSLTLEHMANHPLKVMPPKLTQIGKKIKVRVFSIDNRNILFTKKDSLMKEKTPIYPSADLVKKGDKVVGVVVGQTEYGFVVKSFGDIKGLLTFDEIKKSSSHKIKISDIKSGSVIKTYVLFNKKKSGLALTTDKKKAAKNKENTDQGSDFLSKFGPTEEELETLKQTYSTLIKESSKEELIGQVFQFRCAETKGNYYIAKTIQFAEKKNKVAILPKCLVSSFGIGLPLSTPQFTFEGIVIEHLSGIPVIAFKPELITLSTQIAKSQKDMEADPTLTRVGFVSKVSEKFGVTVRFLNGVIAQVAIKDLQVSQDIQENYKLGQVVSITQNKKGRFSLKSKVLYKSDAQARALQLNAQIKSFNTLFKSATETLSIKIGMKVKAKVQLVKDYGLIAALEGHDDFTGFIVNEQKSSGKLYKVGSDLECIVLDIDTSKKIVDLSEKLAENKSSKQSKSKNQKAIVELNKEQYLIVTFKKARQQVGVCIPNDFTQVNKTELYAKYQVGSEITVKVISEDSENFSLTLLSDESLSQKSSTTKNINLEEGSLVSGPLRSIKGHSLFVQVGSNGKIPTIGRFHRVEAFNTTEFDSFKVGDLVTAKVLRKQEENGRLWIELTRRKQHLNAHKLDNDLLNLLSLETIENGQVVEGLITESVDANTKFISSAPLNVQISAFVRSQLFFSDLISVEELSKADGSIAKFLSKKYKVGKTISLTHNQGKFFPTDKEAKTTYEKGDLVVVRFVKSIGFGVSVQLDEKTFGLIELCELTDEVTANVAAFFSEKGLFIARVIDTDKKGRLQLSSRESVIDQDMWKLIKPDGASAHFKTADSKRQSNANLRNAILKYGVKLVLNKNDLVLGYVTNISKAGCFIQVGHATSIRAGLNELSDKQDFNFQKEMPIGRIVVARITKTEQDNTRFHCSLRQSLVVYGVNQIEFSTLKSEQTVSAIVLAVADGVAFGQLKGTYYKLKIKEVPSSLTAGTICQVQLQKIVKDKLSGKFVQIEPKEATSVQDRSLEHKAQQIFASVQEEAQKDIQMAAKLAKQGKSQKEEQDIEQLILNQRSQNQMEEQIRDLEAIQEIEENKDVDMNDESSQIENDSDAEEMQKIIQQSKVHDESSDSEDDGDEDEDMEEEQDENDDEEMEEEDNSNEIQSSEDEEMEKSDENKEESKLNKKKSESGKSALRQQINLEKQIRVKEAEMRNKDGTQPKTISDFERLLVVDQDQSYLWIQYMAFMLEKLDIDAARRVAERAVKSVSIAAEADKLNLWIAYMNLENKFGKQEQLQEVVKRAVEVNDRLKVYLQLINIYRQSDKTQYVEDIYKVLCKKNFSNLDIWSSYIEFLFEARSKLDAETYTPAKTILQRALQALPKSLHINIISKFGMLEYKYGQLESGRTMFEGIVTNYPKRMDVWSIYMDMEIKYGGANNALQARHLFERCLSHDDIKKKPKKMKLVFRKYMEFESTQGNDVKLQELRKRVEQYLEKAFKQDEPESSSGSDEESGSEKSS